MSEINEGIGDERNVNELYLRNEDGEPGAVEIEQDGIISFGIDVFQVINSEYQGRATSLKYR
jgi:hypothetical protein